METAGHEAIEFSMHALLPLPCFKIQFCLEGVNLHCYAEPLVLTCCASLSMNWELSGRGFCDELSKRTASLFSLD